MPPFSTEGISAASAATGLPSGPNQASGSTIGVAASESLVPCGRCGVRIVGACHQSSLRTPAFAPPVVAAAAVGGAAAAGAVVGVAAGAAAAVVGVAAGAVVGAGACVGAGVGLAGAPA